jgi:hypothetical protein
VTFISALMLTAVKRVPLFAHPLTADSWVTYNAVDTYLKWYANPKAYRGWHCKLRYWTLEPIGGQSQ